MDRPPIDAPPLQLVFRGECLDGFPPQAVRAAVAAALRLNDKRAERLFSGRPVVLRRGLDEATAYRYVVRFAMMGARVRAEPYAPRLPHPAAAPQPEAGTRAPAARRTRRAPIAAPAAGPPPADAARPSTDGIAPAAARPQGRALRWVGIGALYLVGGTLLGLALGPGLNALIEPELPSSSPVTPLRPTDPPPPNLSQPLIDDARTAHASVTRSTAPLATPRTAPLPEAEIPDDVSPDALREYQARYQRAPGHKAFAISSDGPFGWQAGAASEGDARERALSDCRRALRDGDDDCRVVEADGHWLE